MNWINGSVCKRDGVLANPMPNSICDDKCHKCLC